MTDPRLAEVLHLLDPPAGARLWYGGATPIGSLRGVGHVQAAWKPGVDRHSIWELALHIAYWKYAVRRRLEALDLLFGVATHDVYHTGQIQLMKRLYPKPRGSVTA